MRSQSPDYGLDEQVQIVEEEIVTPLLFAVQLKATEKLTRKKTFSFSTERLRDYAVLSLPVMIAVYDAVRDCFYYTWAHHLRQGLDRSTAAAWLVQDSIAIPLVKQLDARALPAIIEEVSSFYAQLRSDGQSRPVSIAFEYDSESESVYQQFIAAIGTVGYSLRNVPRQQASLVLTFTEPALKLQSDEHTVEWPLAAEESRVTAALALLTIALTWVSRARLSLDCLHTLLSSCGTLPDAVEATITNPLLAAAYGSAHRTSEAQLLAETLLEAGNIDLGILLASAFLFDDQHTDQQVLKSSRLLKQALGISAAGDQRATILYSLGNNHRSRGESREAIRYYLLAARESKGYLGKNYWWAEAAGCFFRLKKYRYAEAFYRKALTLPGQENTFNQVLLADALFYQGHYQQAATQLDEYAASSPPTAYAVILYYLSSALAARFGDKKRDASGAERTYFTQLEEESTVADIAPERAEKALELDPLFAPAYFTLGVQAAQRGENKDAAWYFLFAAFLNQQDISAWCNACGLFIGLLSMESSISLESAVFAYAYQVHGPALEAEFAKSTSGMGKGAVKAKAAAKMLVEVARKCEAQYPQQSAVFFRIPDLQQPESNGGFWLSKDSVPDIR